MPDFLFLPSNIKMRAEMGGTAGSHSSVGHANTGQTSNPHTNTHTLMNVHTRAQTNPEQTVRRRSGNLGAPHAGMTNLEHRKLWRETLNNSMPQGCSCFQVFKSSHQPTKFFSHSNSSYPKYIGGQRDEGRQTKLPLCVSSIRTFCTQHSSKGGFSEYTQDPKGKENIQTRVSLRCLLQGHSTKPRECSTCRLLT